MSPIVETTDAGKQFLVAVIVAQAQRDGIALSAVDKKMLLYSETSASESDMGVADQFDAAYTDDEEVYEQKITELFRRAYARDQPDTLKNAAWGRALAALRDEDIYGLVMVDRAGIPRPKPQPGLPRPKPQSELFKTLRWKDVVFGIFALAILVLAVALLSDRFPRKVFLPDWLRMVLSGACLVAVWFAGKLYTQRGAPRSRL